MALRTSPTLLGTFVRAGLICFAAGGRTCLAHGLGATPDSWSLSWHADRSSTGVYTHHVFLESYDSVSMVFVNSSASNNPIGYLRAAVEVAAIH